MTYREFSRKDRVPIVFVIIGFSWYGYCSVLISRGDEPTEDHVEIFEDAGYWSATLDECLIRNSEDCELYEITDGLETREEAEIEVEKFITQAKIHINRYDFLGLKKLPKLISWLIPFALPILLFFIWNKFFKKKEQ